MIHLTDEFGDEAIRALDIVIPVIEKQIEVFDYLLLHYKCFIKDIKEKLNILKELRGELFNERH